MPIPNLQGAEVNGHTKVELVLPWSAVLAVLIGMAMGVGAMWFRTGQNIDATQENTMAVRSLEQTLSDVLVRLAVVENDVDDLKVDRRNGGG